MLHHGHSGRGHILNSTAPTIKMLARIPRVFVPVFYVSRRRERHTAVLFNDAVNCQDYVTRYGDRWKNMSVDHS